MELTPTPPENEDDDNLNSGKGGLVWDPAGAEVNARLGPYTPATVDHLLNPPPGHLAPGSGHPTGLVDHRRKALELLIEMAFQP